jgi:cytochrome c oxidase subunit 4
MTKQKSHPATHDEHEPHACPFWILMTVFVALLILTGITVWTATQVDLGPYNLVLAMTIAVLKGLLVALFFMHLWWDHLINAIAIAFGAGFLALFITFSMMDTYQYEPDVKPLNEVLTTEMIRQTAIQSENSEAE